MKILMIAPEPFFETRGTPFSVYNRSKVLGELGHSIDLVTYHIGQDVTIDNVKTYRIPKIPFIKKVAIGPSFTKIPLDIVLFLKAFLLLVKNKYDCIHVHEEAAFMGILFKMVFRKPLIYDMHSSIPQQLTNFNFTENKNLITLAEIGERWIIKSSDTIIAICPHLAETVKNVNSTKKVHIIENVSISNRCIDLSDKNIEKIKHSIGLKNEIVVLYTGTFEHYQGIDLLIKSIHKVVDKVVDVKYVMVGGEDAQIAKMKKLAESLHVYDFIIFTGKKPADEMPMYMEIADILVSPRSVGTNTPLKIYSYLESGKPIVATNLLTHTQALDEDVAILTEPNPEKFAEGILKLLVDDNLRIQLGQRGKKLADTKYSYDAFKLKNEEVYENIETLLVK